MNLGESEANAPASLWSSRLTIDAPPRKDATRHRD